MSRDDPSTQLLGAISDYAERAASLEEREHQHAWATAEVLKTSHMHGGMGLAGSLAAIDWYIICVYHYQKSVLQCAEEQRPEAELG
jgi:hypothetical protein